MIQFNCHLFINDYLEIEKQVVGRKTFRKGELLNHNNVIKNTCGNRLVILLCMCDCRYFSYLAN